VSDSPDVFAYAVDPEVTHFMDWNALVDVEEAIQFVHRSETTWASGEEFTWVVTELGTDSVIGATSCRVHGDCADFGYVLNRGHWNKGFATEVASALVEMTLTDNRMQRIWATCDAENLRSRRVLEKAGLSYEGLLPTASCDRTFLPSPALRVFLAETER
jgi:ribosomal-protein-alanine N-acetyltransferase